MTGSTRKQLAEPYGVVQAGPSSREVEFILANHHWLLRSRSGSHGGIGDEREWWNTIWIYKDWLLGTAHSHPGSGMTGPSWEDLTTYRGYEVGLGRKLTFYITTSTHLVAVKLTKHFPKIEWEVEEVPEDEYPWWVPMLREMSYNRR